MTISKPNDMQAGIGQADLMEQMRSVTRESMQFHAFTSDLQHQHNLFNTMLHAKLEGMKSLSDLAKDSIQKANYN